MEWNDFHKNWNPPGGEVPWVCLEYEDDAKFVKGRSLYSFPWYLRFMDLWYGFRCWLKTDKWPDRILYFPDKFKRDKELYLAEIAKDPRLHINY